MSVTRFLSFSRSPMRIPSRRAGWIAIAGLLVFLATGAPASATNLLYVSLGLRCGGVSVCLQWPAHHELRSRL